MILGLLRAQRLGDGLVVDFARPQVVWAVGFGDATGRSVEVAFDDAGLKDIPLRRHRRHLLIKPSNQLIEPTHLLSNVQV